MHRGAKTKVYIIYYLDSHFEANSVPPGAYDVAISEKLRSSKKTKNENTTQQHTPSANIYVSISSQLP